jgi:hypothetical protein
MGRIDKPPLRLVTSETGTSKLRETPPPDGSTVVIAVKSGQLCSNVVQALSYEDASALLSGLAMAMVQVIRAQQTL